MVICLERSAHNLHMVQLMPLPPHHLLLHWNVEWFYVSEEEFTFIFCPLGYCAKCGQNVYGVCIA